MATNTHELIRIPTRTLDHINEQLDQAASSNPDGKSRTLKRWDLRDRRVVLTLIKDDGTTSHYLAYPRNLSAGGIGILHGAFVHLGMKCMVSIIDNANRSRNIRGKVVRCAHVSGRVHQVGVNFDEPVRVEDFLALKDERVINIEHVDPNQIEGTILYVEAAQAEQRLFKHQTQGMSVSALFASDSQSCQDMLSESPDVIIVGYQTIPNFAEWITSVRDSGCTSPIVVLTSNACEGLRDEVRSLGAEEAYVKPLTESMVQRICAEFLHETMRKTLKPHTIGGPISSASENDIPIDLLTSCAEEIKAVSETLREAFSKNAFDGLRDTALQLESTAASHGFVGISEAAREFIVQLDSTMSVEESEPQHTRLVTLASKARAVA